MFGIRLLGGFELSPADGSRSGRLGPRPQGLLAFLAMSRGVAVPRGRLAGLLWGERDEDAARHSLSQAMTTLRSMLGPAATLLQACPDGVRLAREGLELDVDAFESAARSRQQAALQAACDLYRGAFLEGIEIREAGFEEWQLSERYRLGELAADAMARLLDQQIAAGEADAAIATARRLVAMVPLDEPAHARLIEIYGSLGRRALAEAHYARCVNLLRRELDQAPGDEIEAALAAARRRPPGTAVWNVQIANIAPPPPTDKPSVTVLAFDNLSGDPDEDYFSHGIAEDIITDLSKISGLLVIARNSAFVYRGRKVRVQDVSRDLGVRYVVQGSVRKGGNRIRITVQLSDGNTGGHVWAERYDRELTDIFAVQDDLTRHIVAALQVKLRCDERRRTRGRGTDHIEAYELFLRARELLQRRTRDDIARSRPLFEQAIDIDPSFATPYAGLAFGHVMGYVNQWTETPVPLAIADRLARQALALDPGDPQSHYTMATVRLWSRDHHEAIREANTATELDPNFSPGYSLLGLTLHYAGRSQEALAELDRAMQLDPYYPDTYLHFLAQCHFSLRQYANAEAVLRRRLVRNPDTDISRALLTACYGHLGRPDHAQVEWQEVLRVNPSYSLEHRRQILPYRNPAELEHLIEGLRKAGIRV